MLGKERRVDPARLSKGFGGFRLQGWFRVSGLGFGV